MTAAACAPEPAPVVVSRYDGTAAAWDAFVRQTPSATFFHLSGWKAVLEETFGFSEQYLVARRGLDIVGVLPLFELKAPFMERGLLSLPFAVDAGVCTSDAAARRALDAAALDLAGRRGAAWVELRDGCDGEGFRTRASRHGRFRCALHADDAANFEALPGRRRNMIRRATRHGLVTRIDPADVATLHDLYARSARRFGTPVFPLRFFDALLRRFPNETAVLTVWRGTTPVAGALALYFGDTVQPYYAGSHVEGFRCAANDFLYWELMRAATARGCRRFDFGRSKIGSGAFKYKRLWGFMPEPMHYRVATLGGPAPPERSTDDTRLGPLQAAWRRLPLRVTKLIGPFFVTRYGPYFT